MKQGAAFLRGIRLALPLYPAQILIFAVAYAVLKVALPYLAIWMPRVVLDGIAAGLAPNVFFLRVGGLALLLVFAHYLGSFVDRVVDFGTGMAGFNEMMRMRLHKYMHMDYDLITDAGFKAAEAKMEQARAGGNGAPAMQLPKILAQLLSNAVGFLLYAGTIALVHPLMLPVLSVTAAVNWYMLSRARKYDNVTRGERGAILRRLRTLRETIQTPAAAKDLRLYHADKWLSETHRGEYDAHLDAEEKMLTKTMQARLIDAAMLLLRDGLAYTLLIGLVLGGRITPGEFVFAFAAVGGLAGWISGTLTAGAELARACTGVCDMFEMLRHPDRTRVTGIPLPIGDALPPHISLRGVGYTYPGAEAPALRNVTVEVKAGERIAIVGVNGAGKTTLVKLLCGLCLPTEGDILVSGAPIGDYARDEYFGMVGVVFQDIHLMATSVAVNVAQTTDYDRERVLRCLAIVGLDTAPEAPMVRAVHPDGIELSGGQKQKLAIARALYKDAPLLLLDEPTAALDPIAEREIYENYAELTAGKTSFYISHRLASTRFCDRILLLDGGVIAEEGTHNELMALDGRYAEMFALQAGYYRGEVAQ